MFSDMALKNFVSEVSSSAPTPGGGSVSALGAALAASLFEMVVRISYKNIEEDMAEYLSVLEPLRKEASELIDRDSEAFKQVMAAYALPKSTDEDKKLRSEAIQESLKNAALTPMRTAQVCMALMRLTAEIALISKESCVSDVAVAFHFAESGFKGAIYNVVINISSIKDESFASETRESIAGLEEWYNNNCSSIETVLRQRLNM